MPSSSMLDAEGISPTGLLSTGFALSQKYGLSARLTRSLQFLGTRGHSAVSVRVCGRASSSKCLSQVMVRGSFLGRLGSLLSVSLRVGLVAIGVCSPFMLLKPGTLLALLGDSRPLNNAVGGMGKQCTENTSPYAHTGTFSRWA